MPTVVSALPVFPGVQKQTNASVPGNLLKNMVLKIIRKYLIHFVESRRSDISTSALYATDSKLIIAKKS